MKNKLLFGIPAMIILIFFDQFTKFLAVKYLKGLPNGKSIIGTILKIQYLENRGAAFGLLQNKLVLFYIFSILFLFLFAYLYLKLPVEKRFLPINVLLIFFISGAIGNLIDRVRLKYVIDFIYVSIINFPIFNVADIYVTCSCIVFFLLVVFYYKEEDFNKIKLFKR